MKVTEDILFDDNENYIFSNFSAFSVIWKGKLWPTSEQAYQAAKFSNVEIQEKIRNASNPIVAYQIAHDNKSYMDPAFNQIKIKVMKEILLEKISQHELIQMKLKDSGSRRIVKNFKGDNYWGSGPDGKGENMLGKLWMEIRQELQNK